MKDKTTDFLPLISRILRRERHAPPPSYRLRRAGMACLHKVRIYFADDKKMRELNKKFRGIDRTTDVLSFPMNEKNDLGEVVISQKYALKNVEQLVIHGVLHLLGHDHKKAGERNLMREKEELYLK